MRHKPAPKRKLAPDPKYKNVIVAKLINYVMTRGKKSTAEKVVYSAFDIIAEKTKEDPLTVFDSAIKNLSPLLEVKSKRVGGANYQIPMPVRGERKLALAFRWLLLAARTKKGKPMAEKLSAEIMLAAKNEGDAFKKKMDVQRMAEANRAFAHFAKY